MQSLDDTFLSACAKSSESSVRRLTSRYEVEVLYFMRVVWRQATESKVEPRLKRPCNLNLRGLFLLSKA
jgi:hypothetical protein